MKKLLTHILLLYFLAINFLPNGGVVELFKAGNLLRHFTHHQVVHVENINFIEFLVLHYLDTEHQKKDAHEHADLPFQNQGNLAFTTGLSFVFLPPHHFSWNFNVYSIQNIVNQGVSNQNSILSSFHLSIWQPPRQYKS